MFIVAKPRKPVRHIAIRLFPSGGGGGGAVKMIQNKRKVVNLGGEGTNNQFTTQPKFTFEQFTFFERNHLLRL